MSASMENKVLCSPSCCSWLVHQTTAGSCFEFPYESSLTLCPRVRGRVCALPFCRVPSRARPTVRVLPRDPGRSRHAQLLPRRVPQARGERAGRLVRVPGAELQGGGGQGQDLDQRDRGLVQRAAEGLAEDALRCARVFVFGPSDGAML